MHFAPEIEDRMLAFCHARSVEVEGILGSGKDGVVWYSNRLSALKVHKLRTRYLCERDVYRRLEEKSLSRLAGFNIPVLLQSNDDFLALELSIVKPPFALDFADAVLDSTIPEFDDRYWMEDRARVFGPDWPDVRRLLNALLQYGVALRDVHPKNISSRVKP